MKKQDVVRIRYQTIEINGQDIHLCTLKDNQQFADNLGEAESYGISSAQWSLFGVVWPSSEVLAYEMVNFDISGKRILELGCGIGLSSLLLNTRNADITATDIHPEAAHFIAENTRLNHSKRIPFLRTGWEEKHAGLGQFDVIIGSDILYEREHIELLAAFIERHAKQACEIILVDPGRSNHAPFSKKMIELGYQHKQWKPEDRIYATGPFKGVILNYCRH